MSRTIERLFVILTWIAILGTISFLCLLGYWMFRPYKIIDVKQPATVLNQGKVLNRGDILSYKLEYTKYMNISAKVLRQLENDRVVCLMQGAGQAKMGCNSTIIDVLIPLNIWPGKYRLHVFYEYDVNPARPVIKYDYYTEWFEVLP